MNYTWEVCSFKHSWPSAYGQGADLALGRIGVAALRLSSAVEAKKKHGRTPRSELERARETERDRERSVFACLSICRVGAGSRAEGDGFKEWECASDGTRCISSPLVWRLTRRPKHIVLPCATVLERFNAEKKGVEQCSALEFI